MSKGEPTTFNKFGFYPWIIRQLHTLGVRQPTPVQLNCIAPILEGRDCIAASETGSGKTFAFALPILQKLCEDPYGIYAIVLTPTRELACQIADQFSVVGKGMNLRHCIIIGGVDIVEQSHALNKKPHVVIATPGRLADLVENGHGNLFKHVRFLVLDEADSLVKSDNFNQQLKVILNVIPTKRQNLYFSATIGDSLEILKSMSSSKYFLYEAPKEVMTVDQLDQRYVLSPPYAKDAYFFETIRSYVNKDSNGSILVFTESCKKCQVISLALNDVGFKSVALHSMIKQKERLDALAAFRSNVVKILIATDVAARGLDIPNVQLVVNYSLPKVPKEYVHRVGRTARAGRAGNAISIITPRDITLLHQIEECIKCKLVKYEVDDKEVATIFGEVSVALSKAHIKLDEEDFYEKRLVNKKKKLIDMGLDPDNEELLFGKRKRKKKNLLTKKQ